MDIQPTVSLGDLVIACGMAAAAAANYFAVVNKQKATDWKVEELRRGRGLILEHWPPSVRRCFGYSNGTERQTQRD